MSSTAKRMSLRLEQGRTMKSGPTVNAISADDERAVRMANALGGVIGSDRDRLDTLISQLDGARKGCVKLFESGLNDVSITITQQQVFLWDDYLDAELNDDEQGKPYTHEELEDALQWWKIVVNHWWSERHGNASRRDCDCRK